MAKKPKRPIDQIRDELDAAEADAPDIRTVPPEETEVLPPQKALPPPPQHTNGAGREEKDANEKPRGRRRKRSGRGFTMEETEPWERPVDGDALLSGIAKDARRFLVLPDHADTLLSLFVVHAHAIDAARHSPRLKLHSPLPRCGKTRTLQFLRPIVPKPLKLENITASAVFRTVEAVRPCLLVDEADYSSPPPMN